MRMQRMAQRSGSGREVAHEVSFRVSQALAGASCSRICRLSGRPAAWLTCLAGVRVAKAQHYRPSVFKFAAKLRTIAA